MIQTVYKDDFRRAFKGIRPDNFTPNALDALFDYFEGLEEDGIKVELDVIAICCEYTEYESIEEFQENYDSDEYSTHRAIEDRTTIIRVGTAPEDEGFIIQDF